MTPRLPARTDPIKKFTGVKKHLVIVLCFLAVTLSCDMPERPSVVMITNAPSFRPATPNEVGSVEKAMAAIISICRDDLKLPSVDPLILQLYKNSRSFQTFRGRRTQLSEPTVYPAVARQNEIHIDLEKTGTQYWGPSIRLLAHEYAHNIHYSLVGSRATQLVWFAEGFAEWVAARVVDRLGWQSYSTTLSRTLEEIAHHKISPKQLFLLKDQAGWRRTLQEPSGHVKTYGLAFAVVAHQISNEGLSNTIQNIKSGEIETRIHHYIVNNSAALESFALSKHERSGQYLIDAPKWKIGDYWEYKEATAGATSVFRREVSGHTLFQGIGVFVVKVRDEEELYVSQTYALLANRRDNRVVVRRNKPNEFFVWPLIPNKVWINRFTAYNLDYKHVFHIDRTMKSSYLETLSLPAGTFKTVRIQVWDNETGRLEAEYWYSPEARWFVKTIIYDSTSGFAKKQLLLGIGGS